MKTPMPLHPAPRLAGRTLDAQLHLLDRHVLDSNGTPVTTGGRHDPRDLLGTPVLDASGARLGRVADVRFVVDGSPHQLLADARLLGLVVGPHSQHPSSDTNGPGSPSHGRWPACSLACRGSFLVLWANIALVSAGSVQLRDRFTAYNPALDNSGQE